MKPTAIRIEHLELRLRGATPRPEHLAQQIGRAIAMRGAAPLPSSIEAGLAGRLAAPLANTRRK